MRPLQTYLIPFVLMGLLLCACKDTTQQASSQPASSPDSTAVVPLPPSQPDDTLRYEDWVDYSQGIPVRKGKLLPLDQGPLNTHFTRFRTLLLQAIEEKDAAFLLDHVDASIKMSYGVENGKQDFITSWELDNRPGNSRIWDHLRELLQLGGIFMDKTLQSFTAPYTFHADVPDPYEYYIITGTEVRIRQKPSLQGAVLGSLNYDVVLRAPYDPDETQVVETIGGESHPWIKIQFGQQDTGYVFGKFVRSPIDFRANFTHKNGKWMMTFFVAGD